MAPRRPRASSLPLFLLYVYLFGNPTSHLDNKWISSCKTCAMHETVLRSIRQEFASDDDGLDKSECVLGTPSMCTRYIAHKVSNGFNHSAPQARLVRLSLQPPPAARSHPLRRPPPRQTGRQTALHRARSLPRRVYPVLPQRAAPLDLYADDGIRICQRLARPRQPAPRER